MPKIIKVGQCLTKLQPAVEGIVLYSGPQSRLVSRTSLICGINEQDSVYPPYVSPCRIWSF